MGHLWYAAASRGLAAYTALYTTREFMRHDPESLLRVTRGMYRTQQWIATHSAAEFAACVAAYFSDLARATWLIVSFGALLQSRSISRYDKGLCPVNCVYSSAPYSHSRVGSASWRPLLRVRRCGSSSR